MSQDSGYADYHGNKDNLTWSQAEKFNFKFKFNLRVTTMPVYMFLP